MKTKSILTILGTFVFLIASAQHLQKQYYANDSKLGGDVVIKTSEIFITNKDEIQKTFEIESPIEGTFYLDAWLSAPFTPEGYPEYGVKINNIISSVTLKPQTSRWGSVALTDCNKIPTTVKLKKGLNTISIIGKNYEVPNVEHVKLSSSGVNAGISNTKYEAYIKDIQSNNLGFNSEFSMLPTDSVVSRALLAGRGTNGETYTYQLNMPVPYTTIYIFYFEAGTTIDVNVTQSTNYEYVIEFFDMNNFTNSRLSNSWSKLCKGNGSLQVVIPQPAFYMVRLRAYKQMSTGLANLRVNNNSYTDCIISGNGIPFTGTNSQTESFTCHSPYQICFFLEGSGLPGTIQEYKIVNTAWPNDKYGCQLSLPGLANVGSGLISGSASSDPIHYADVYLGLTKVDSNTLGFFPNLKQEESYCSAPGTGLYNCISWTVGITDDWIFPSETDLSAWDAFYNSYGYTRSGANADNGAIAVWVNNGLFKHGSVRKNTTILKPHGFDWESKCGSLPRVMHLRDALSGSSYGNITYYYRPISGSVNSLIAPSNFIRSTFLSTELNTIEALISDIPSDIASEFERKYSTWEKTWSQPDMAICSNPRDYAASKEYVELLQWCQKYGKMIWPLFIDKLAKGDVFVSNLLEDLTSPQKENKKLYDEAIGCRTRLTGFSSPFIYSNMVEYARRLLAQEYNNIGNAIQNRVELENVAVNIAVDNNNIILAVNTEKVLSILVNIYDVYGISVYTANYNILDKGWETRINTSKFTTGTYVVQIVMNGEIISRKISI